MELQRSWKGFRWAGVKYSERRNVSDVVLFLVCWVFSVHGSNGDSSKDSDELSEESKGNRCCGRAEDGGRLNCFLGYKKVTGLHQKGRNTQRYGNSARVLRINGLTRDGTTETYFQARARTFS